MRTRLRVFGVWASGLLLLAGERALAYYDPGVQRWINRDPAPEGGFRASSGTSLGRASDEPRTYQLALNCPVSRWDYLGLDNPGCDLPLSLVRGAVYQRNKDCFLRCCAKHDECYYQSDCTSSSWFVNLVQVVAGRCGPYGMILTLGLEFHPCGRCNQAAAMCFANCAVGLDAGGAKWFCPNGPVPPKGNFYDDYKKIPAVCWQDGQKPETAP
jgi:hypothetical protein